MSSQQINLFLKVKNPPEGGAVDLSENRYSWHKLLCGHYNGFNYIFFSLDSTIKKLTTASSN